MYKALKFIGVIYIIAAFIVGFYLFSLYEEPRYQSYFSSNSYIEMQNNIVVGAGVGVIAQGLIIGLIATVTATNAEMLEELSDTVKLCVDKINALNVQQQTPVNSIDVDKIKALHLDQLNNM